MTPTEPNSACICINFNLELKVFQITQPNHMNIRD